MGSSKRTLLFVYFLLFEVLNPGVNESLPPDLWGWAELSVIHLLRSDLSTRQIAAPRGETQEENVEVTFGPVSAHFPTAADNSSTFTTV